MMHFKDYWDRFNIFLHLLYIWVCESLTKNMFFWRWQRNGDFFRLFSFDEKKCIYGDFDVRNLVFSTFIQYVIFRFFLKNVKSIWSRVRKSPSRSMWNMGKLMRILIHMVILNWKKPYFFVKYRYFSKYHP